MARGDQIYVMRPLMGLSGVYEHHGIDCGDGTVIHYAKLDVAQVSRTSWGKFAAGNPVYVKNPPTSYITDVVMQRAESRLGERQYSLLSNNCEHFATWCKTGRNESAQLASFGLDVSQIQSSAIGSLMTEALQEGDAVKAKRLVDQALGNVAIARTQIQSQYDQAQKEGNTWKRVAQLALQRGREDLARAALTRKVEIDRRLPDLTSQLEQLADMQRSLDQNKQRA
jgi:Lecithin retinol acyltransferase